MNYIDIKNESFYTPEEVAEKLKLSVATIYKLIKEEKFPYVKIGKSYRVLSSALSQYIITQGNLSNYLKASPVPTQTINYFLDEIQKAPKKYKDVIIAIVLFGPHARAEADCDSDIDLLILTSVITIDIQKFISEISSAAMERGGFNDLLSPMRMSLSHWEELKEAGSPLYKEIFSDGIVLWPNQLKSLKDIENELMKN